MEVNFTDYVTQQEFPLLLDEIKAVAGFNSEEDIALKWILENGYSGTLDTIRRPGAVIVMAGNDMHIVKENVEVIEALLYKFNISIEKRFHRHSNDQEYIVVNNSKIRKYQPK